MENQKPEAMEEEKQFAIFIAMVIRNAMEDFHVAHLSDEQMKELNPIIRNAVCTALHAFNHYGTEPPAKRFIDFHLRMVPKYWEPPELLPAYVGMWDERRFERSHAALCGGGRGQGPDGHPGGEGQASPGSCRSPSAARTSGNGEHQAAASRPAGR